MEEIINLGISENTIKCMLELNPNIKDMNNNEIIEKEYILKNIGCDKTQIVNIISSNSLYLDRTNDGIISLINKLIKLGFKNLNILFDSNPYILNLEPFEIDEYINRRISNGEILENIVSDLDSNPILFNEM